MREGPPKRSANGSTFGAGAVFIVVDEGIVGAAVDGPPKISPSKSIGFCCVSVGFGGIPDKRSITLFAAGVAETFACLSKNYISFFQTCNTLPY